jgi:hypothetical protein
MYIQREFLRTSASMTQDSTYRVSLPDNGYITSLLLVFASKPVVDKRLDVAKWRFVDFLPKVEILGNQATVVKSFTGRMAHVQQWLDGGPLVHSQDHNYGTSTLRSRLPILFGRKYFDTEYGLDLSRWDDVELRITNDATSTYFSADPTVDVLVNYVREVPGNPFRGYFRTEEWNNYTTVASEKKYLELPTEYKIRRILLQVDPLLDASHSAARTCYQTLDDIELFLKTGLLKMWDGNLRYLWYDNLFSDGRAQIVGAEQYATDAKGFRTGLGQTFYKAGVYVSHDGGQSTYAPDIVPGEDGPTQSRQSDGDSDQTSLLMQGIAPESCAWFNFTTPDDPAGYLDPAAQKTVQLHYTIGSDSSDTAGTIRTVLDRFIPY